MASALLSVSMRSFSFASAAALAAASSFMRLISASVRPDDASIRILCSLPVALSFADTLRIPFASISNVTSIWGMPRGAGAMPSRWNLPRVLSSLAIGRSPWSTWISTDGWLSAAVENVSLLRVGMVVLASMSFVITPPRVSMPTERGTTSSRSTSFTSPDSTPPCIAAPTATTSSGFTPFEGCLPKNLATISCIAGIRVEPPTRITSSMSLFVMPASLRACSHGGIVAWIRRSASCSNFARVRVLTRCFGIPFTGMM